MRLVKFVCIGLVVLLVLGSGVKAIGIGVAPSEIKIHDAFRGEEYRKTITVSNADEHEATFSFNVSGECADWISFYKPEDITTPITSITIPGNEKREILVVFKIPNDAENRIYNSAIIVQRAPKAVEGGVGAGVALKMPISVTIEVTGVQKLTGEVRDIRTTDVEVNYPLRIKVDFQNTGNVIARPLIEVAIVKDNMTIDTFTYADTAVKPNERKIISVEWDTTGREVGDYIAKVTVSLGGEILATKDLTFKLLPVGTLSRKGSLIELKYEGELLVGRVVKILATFRNIGEIDTKAKFVGEVFMDGALIDTLHSEEILVPVRETRTLIAYLKIEKEGNYKIRGYVVYEGKTTDTKEISFNVGGTGTKSTPTPPGFGTIGVVIAIVFVTHLIHRKRTSNRQKRWRK